jgi:hypothetical protein
MFGRRRLTFITYLLAISIFLLTVSGDGSVILGRLSGMSAEIAGAAEFQALSSRTERTDNDGNPLRNRALHYQFTQRWALQ